MTTATNSSQELSRVRARVVQYPIRLELFNQGDQKALVELPILKAREEHRSFILATWIRSYQPVARRFMSRTDYLREDAAVAESLWRHSHVVSSDGFAIQAWMCSIGSTLHHCYVVPELRRKGITRALTRLLVGDRVEVARPWPFPTGPRWSYNPFKIKG